MRLSRRGNTVSITLQCTATGVQKCATKLTAIRNGHATHSSATLTAGTSRKVSMHLAGGKHAHGMVTVVAQTGSYTASRRTH